MAGKRVRREEIDARVNDFSYARKRPRLSYAKISNINLRVVRVCTCTRAGGWFHACVSTLGRVLARPLVEYSNDGRTYNFCTFNIARVSVEVFTATAHKSAGGSVLELPFAAALPSRDSTVDARYTPHSAYDTLITRYRCGIVAEYAKKISHLEKNLHGYSKCFFFHL